ncbi:hypothetical protein BD779DRAFT_1666866 [Infundibulicybe gibba]|nr:hypothetical protein BD779DRAFT_1666866 [Infundibulicybe gibba]
MIALSTLHNLLSQLVSAATDPSRPRDAIRIVVGLSGELGRIVVLPVDDDETEEEDIDGEDYQPLMLLALNSTNTIAWEELQSKGKILALHLAKPLNRFREHLAIARPPVSATVSSPVQLTRT